MKTLLCPALCCHSTVSPVTVPCIEFVWLTKKKASRDLWKWADGRSARTSLSPGNWPQAPCAFNHCQSFSLMHFGRLGRTDVSALSRTASYLCSAQEDEKQQTCTLSHRLLWILLNYYSLGNSPNPFCSSAFAPFRCAHLNRKQKKKITSL